LRSQSVFHPSGHGPTEARVHERKRTVCGPATSPTVPTHFRLVSRTEGPPFRSNARRRSAGRNGALYVSAPSARTDSMGSIGAPTPAQRVRTSDRKRRTRNRAKTVAGSDQDTTRTAMVPLRTQVVHRDRVRRRRRDAGFNALAVCSRREVATQCQATFRGHSREEVDEGGDGMADPLDDRTGCGCEADRRAR